MKTYVSLFSSAGVGCFGFKLEGFECVATNEIIERRLDVQRFNKKCKYDTGYICGDITLDETKKLIYNEVSRWKEKEHIKGIDVVIATPPCQGMSVANHKKKENEIVRNSLVVESIKTIKNIHPNFFVFENVPAFMKTICTDIDGKNKTISDAIDENLGSDYIFSFKVINFKNYGACSSRSRTIVIGVLKEISDYFTPFDFFPDFVKEKTLRDTIGNLKSLTEIGEIDANDIYHSFRQYPEYMRKRIHNLKEGESSFDNREIEMIPHQIIDGEIVLNKRKNGDKYTRQFWDKVGPCVHTRNDQLASQNTIHPKDDRVFSIRELMLMMTVPSSFKWSDYDFKYLNSLSIEEKKKYLKKEEIKIRQSLGEAVPTIIFQSIAHKISFAIESKRYTLKNLKDIILKYDLSNSEKILSFISKNFLNLTNNELSLICELTNSKKESNSAYYTNKSLIFEIINRIDVPDKDLIEILEPSVGIGNFLPFIIKKFEGKKIILDIVDIDNDSLQITKALLEKYHISDDVIINYINDDFLSHNFNKKYDFVIGNPPFGKAVKDKINFYKKRAINKNTNNLASLFFDKAYEMSDNIFFIMPKFLLNTPEFNETRKYIEKKNIKYIIDFGEKGFNGVKIETVAIYINIKGKPSKTNVISLTKNINLEQNQEYITDNQFPYWIIYRDEKFDNICKKLEFNKFNVFRDRQITNSIIDKKFDYDEIKVLKSRNIDNFGKIVSIDGYDSYIKEENARKLAVYKFLNKDNVYLVPNMTYKPRMTKKPKNTLVNGSIAVLIPIDENTVLNKTQISYFSTDEYRQFYQIARNYQTRSLNVDSCSVYFYGLLKD